MFEHLSHHHVFVFRHTGRLVVYAASLYYLRYFRHSREKAFQEWSITATKKSLAAEDTSVMAKASGVSFSIVAEQLSVVSLVPTVRNKRCSMLFHLCPIFVVRPSKENRIEDRFLRTFSCS